MVAHFKALPCYVYYHQPQQGTVGYLASISYTHLQRVLQQLKPSMHYLRSGSAEKSLGAAMKGLPKALST